jgi:hypothetical protein
MAANDKTAFPQLYKSVQTAAGCAWRSFASAGIVDHRSVVIMRKVLVTLAAIMLANCAGRDPQPIATVQPTDANATCAMIVAEIEANNIKVKELAGEEGGKVAQNVAAGVAGIVIPVLWFGMDFKGAASKEVAALQARQQYLTILATERCAPGKKGS